MTAWLDKLNLQPQERRMVLGGLVVVALVLNYWIIWPYFGEWSKVGNELSKADSRKNTYLAEIGKKATYDRQLKEVEKAGAGGVLAEEQANRVQSTLYTQAATHGVTVTSLTPSRTAGQTNVPSAVGTCFGFMMGRPSGAMPFAHVSFFTNGLANSILPFVRSRT